jgi:hypothetical protein
MNDDDIDVMLREYAPRWRAAQPPAPTAEAARRVAMANPMSRPATTRAGRRTVLRWRSRQWLPMVAAAVAVGLVAGGIGLVRTHSAPQPGYTPTPSPSQGLAVWWPMPETNPTIPTTIISPSPDPAPAADLRPCRSGDLSVSSNSGVAGGTRIIEVLYQSDQPCQVNGYPEIIPLGRNSRPVDVPVEHEVPEYGNPVALGGGIAVVRLTWTSLWCADEVEVANIMVYTSPTSAGTVDGFGESQCYGQPGSGTKEPIRVTEFRPLHFTAGRAGTPFDEVSADLALPGTAKAGETVRFRVTLTAPRDVVLDPCPDYSITIGHVGNQTDVAYALNCAAVVFRDGAGRPYLPAGTPVTFAMQATAPPAGGRTEKVTWRLEDTGAVGGGTVEVLEVR